MRFLVLTTIIVLFVLLMIFMFTNPGTVPRVVLFGRTFVDVPLYVVVSLALLVGILFTFVVAVAEGANTRIANRRLIRQIQKMETEINYLRTQPSRGKSEPDDLPKNRSSTTSAADAPAGSGGSASAPPPSAPVYGTSDRHGGGEDDDEGTVYTGGRAV